MKIRILVLLVGLCPLVWSGCGGQKASTAGPGQKCDPDADPPCKSGLVCEPDGEGTKRCQRPVGATCDPSADDAHCLLGSECFGVTVGGGGSTDAGMGDTGANGSAEIEGQCRVTEDNACDVDEPLCAPHLTCAEETGGGHACHAPVVIRGDVRDSSDDSAIEGAHVIGLNERRVAVTDVAVSNGSGAYELQLPVVRQDDGKPTSQNFTLRAQAADYQPFPDGLRQAIPLDTANATETDATWVVDTAPTDIALIPLPEDARGHARISGSVLADGDRAAGVLVVAESNDDAYTAVSDRTGAYTLFNVPPGDYEVTGYAAGLQLEPQTASVADEPVEDVDLAVADRPTGTVSGSVNIVDTAGGGKATSVVLVVASTFDETLRRGDIPPGLRAPKTGEPSVTGQWSIDGVPDGDYVALAGFENDGLVQDPDTNIAGTDPVSVSVPDGGNRDVSLAETFKVTHALDVIGPGRDGPESVDSAPTLRWKDDSSEDGYVAVVYNAFGEKVWEKTGIASVMGSDEVSVAYDGPTKSGMYYQFRARSWSERGGKGGGKGGGSGKRSTLSATEDLRGVFFIP